MSAPPVNSDGLTPVTLAPSATNFLPLLLAGLGAEETAAPAATVSLALAATAADNLRLAMTVAPPWAARRA